MDYRLPALDGVQVTKVAPRRLPGSRRRLPDCLREPARGRRALRSRRGRVPDEGRATRRDRRRHQEGRRTGRVMKLTAENTAIVLDSTADFPEGPPAPSWRIVPLYVRFGAESYRDYVDIGPAEFYARLRTADELPTTSQPTPADFLAAYEELAGYERVLSLHLSSKLSGTFDEREPRGVGRRATACAGHRHRHGFCGDRDARARDPAPARAGDDRRGGGRAARTVQARVGARLHARHARVPGTRRAHRPRRRAGRASSCTSSRSSRSREGEVLPVKRVRGNRKAIAGVRERVRGRHRRRPGAACRDRPCRGTRADGRAREARPRPAPAGRARDRRRRSAPFWAPTPARARSGSSG